MRVKMPRPLGRAEQREKFDQRQPDDGVRDIMFEQPEHENRKPFAAAILYPRRQLSVNFTLTCCIMLCPVASYRAIGDRKSVVLGKCVAVRVDLGVALIFKKKKNQDNII